MENAFVINNELTAVSLAYMNKRHIADKIFPRVPVSTASFKYEVYPKESFFTVPETLMGRKGSANEVDLKSKEETASVKPHGLKEYVPYADIEAAQQVGKTDPTEKVTLQVSNLLSLSREKRVADKFNNAANFGGSQILSGASQFNATGSDPIKTICDAIDSMIVAPNKAVTSRLAMSALVRNPAIVKAYNANSGDSGIVPYSYIAELFGLDEILVGDALINANKKGQAVSLTGVWGNIFALYYTDPLADLQSGGLTFGLTGEYVERQVFETDDANKGTGKGSKLIKVEEQVEELIIAPDCGYLLKNVIS